MFKKKTTKFVSEIDKMLTTFDKTHELSQSQQAEIRKHEKIFALRDAQNKDSEKADS